MVTRLFPLSGEMALLALFLALWQLVRIPLQGSLPVSLAHAHDWLALERAVHLDVEASLLRVAHHPAVFGLLHWGYLNLHLAAIFGFMALARLLAPDRYPRLRTAFILAHVPAILVIGLFPLAPPRWMATLPFGTDPSPGSLGYLTNATAAAASMHVGYPIFIAVSTIWLVRSRLAWLAVAYPAAVFFVVVGTGNHYVLDAVVGGVAVALGFLAAWLIDRRSPSPLPEHMPRRLDALLAASGYALIGWAANAAAQGRLTLAHPSGAGIALVGAAVVATAAYLARRPRPSGPEAPGRGPVRRAVRMVWRWLGQVHSPKVEIGTAVGLYVLYEVGRALVAERFELARQHAEDVIAIERSVHLLWEQDIQHAMLRLPGLVDLLGAAYLSLHLGATVLVLVWLYRNHRNVFPVARTALIVATSLALVVHVAFPTAPPRLVGFTIDTVVSKTQINLNSDLLGALYNPIAAMPSMHFGYALLVGVMLAKLSRSRVMRIVGLLYVPLVLFVIVSTGNHFILDAAAGGAVMLASWLVAAAIIGDPDADRLGFGRTGEMSPVPSGPDSSRL